jgi:hypothetical protein
MISPRQASSEPEFGGQVLQARATLFPSPKEE